eukprot:COSAG01_NODE_4091_length_5357_cov_9.914036_5_plen_192_part_00
MLERGATGCLRSTAFKRGGSQSRGLCVKAGSHGGLLCRAARTTAYPTSKSPGDRQAAEGWAHPTYRSGSTNVLRRYAVADLLHTRTYHTQGTQEPAVVGPRAAGLGGQHRHTAAIPPPGRNTAGGRGGCIWCQKDRSWGPDGTIYVCASWQSYPKQPAHLETGLFDRLSRTRRTGTCTRRKRRRASDKHSA